MTVTVVLCRQGYPDSQSVQKVGEWQDSALPGHMCQGSTEPAPQNDQSRATAEVTTKNIEALPAFLQHTASYLEPETVIRGGGREGECK